MLVTRLLLALLIAAAAACSGSAGPADLRAGERCAHCRMAVSNQKMSGQVAAPGDEPLFYDDIGCLASAIAAGTSREFAYVAEHRTGQWIKAGEAVYTHVPTLETPMGSHLVAHADAASQRADPAAAGGKTMTAAEVFDGRKGGEGGA